MRSRTIRSGGRLRTESRAVSPRPSDLDLEPLAHEVVPQHLGDVGLVLDDGNPRRHRPNANTPGGAIALVLPRQRRPGKPESCRWRKALAFIQSRRTVRSSMPSTWPVSTSESPPKKRSSTTRASRALDCDRRTSASSSASSSSLACAASIAGSSSSSRAASPLPRFAARRAQARSTRRQRMAIAAVPSRWPRDSQGSSSSRIRRR